MNNYTTTRQIPLQDEHFLFFTKGVRFKRFHCIFSLLCKSHCPTQAPSETKVTFIEVIYVGWL